MMNMKRKAIFTALLAAIALVLALMTGCQAATAQQGGITKTDTSAKTPVAFNAAAQTGVNSPAASDSGLIVTGQGKTSMKPDVAYITLGVQTQDADAGKARTANDAAMAKVIAAVKGFGVADADITTTNYNIYPTYDDKGVKVVGYSVTNTINVRVKALDKLGDVLTAASTAGANTAYGISFDVLDRTAAYNDALSQAMGDAQARAQIMAKALGVKVGKVLTINESSSSSGPVLPAADSGMMAAGSKAIAVPTASGQVDISASVSVVYEILK